MGKVILSGAAALAIAAWTSATAQAPGSRHTREFVQAAAQSDQFEVLEARTALTQSADPQVRAFAEQMIQDHERTSLQLRQATARAGLPPPPPGLGDDQAKLLGGLQGLRGPEFDLAYARQQALAHRAALVTERQYAATGDNAILRQVASAAIPIITGHLSMAERMRDKLPTW